MFVKFFSTVRRYLFTHKVILLVVLALIAGGGYWAYTKYTSTDGETRYVLGVVEKGTIVASISASGQVAASDQVDVKTKSAGEIVSVSVKAGQKVAQGQLLAYIDSVAAERAVVDAGLAVEEAQINLEHDTLQAPIDYKTLQQNVEKARRDLNDLYEDIYVSISRAFVDLPDVMTGMDDILYGENIGGTSQNISAYQNLFISTTFGDSGQIIKTFTTRAEEDYKTARTAYNSATLEFKKLIRASSPADMEAMLSRARSMSVFVAQAATSEVNMNDTVVDLLTKHNRTVSGAIMSAQTSSRSYLTTANSVLSSLTTTQKNLQSAKDIVTDADHALELASVGNPSGTNPFDLKLLQNTLKQKQAALADAKLALADHSIRAPFAGILAVVTVKRGDGVSSGATVGTLISDQKIAQLSLNEVDVAHVEIGDRATFSFDAIEDLTLTGKVVEIDSVGTVSQNVVSYKMKIGFDTQDTRVKPGMTVNASIQTDTRQDILLVPSSAVKTQNDVSVVQMFEPALANTDSSQGALSETAPRQVEVTIGIADDTNVEIRSGLEEGQQIVTRIITRTATTNIAPAANGGGNRGGFGGPGGGAGGLRVPGIRF
ncbi:MAG: efflux RND transporter periplasmic adaptor subunit [Patescibacteria group bacterium]